MIRDYAGFGLCRLLLFISLIFCYTLLYFAEPNQTDTLLYTWSLQYGAGVGLIVTYQQLSRMFPENKGLILGTLNLAAQASTLWPQAWDILIAKKYLTINQIFLIWIGLAGCSGIAGCFLLPWYSIKAEIPWNGNTKYETLYHVIKNKTGIFERTEESIKEQFKQNVQYLKSPMLFVYGL